MSGSCRRFTGLLASPGRLVFMRPPPQVIPARSRYRAGQDDQATDKPERLRDVGAALALEDGDLSEDWASELRLGEDFLGADSGVARQIDEYGGEVSPSCTRSRLFQSPATGIGLVGHVVAGASFVEIVDDLPAVVVQLDFTRSVSPIGRRRCVLPSK